MTQEGPEIHPSRQQSVPHPVAAILEATEDAFHADTEPTPERLSLDIVEGLWDRGYVIVDATRHTTSQIFSLALMFSIGAAVTFFFWYTPHHHPYTAAQFTITALLGVVIGLSGQHLLHLSGLHDRLRRALPSVASLD